MKMDKYDFMILDIIQNFKLENQNHIRLSVHTKSNVVLIL